MADAPLSIIDRDSHGFYVLWRPAAGFEGRVTSNRNSGVFLVRKVLQKLQQRYHVLIKGFLCPENNKRLVRRPD